MDPEELELQNDYRYRSYAAVIEKALRNFESSSEWADLISSLGKLNKALQSNLRYSLLPKRLIIGKRLAQCLHPALPSGVHLKALETYEVIFKIIGTKWLAKDLFIYSSGLFPLLGHAAMAVKPVLLTLYERYYLPLQKALLPSLQAFVTGLLPGLEEGLGVYDRTDALLFKLSQLVGQQVFYGALWGSMLVSPLVRLPASVFIVTHFDRMLPLYQQRYMLGYDHRLVVKAVCLSLQDSNVLVQRNMLEILLYFFPFAVCLHPAEASIAMSIEDLITVVAAASLTLLRRDMSLNRRLYAWLLGTDIKGEMVAPHPTLSTTVEEHASFYFSTYSRDFLIQALIKILKQKDVESNPENVITYLRPFRIIISLLDKPEIGPVVLSSMMLEVVRAFYSYCREMVGEENTANSGLSGSQLASKIKENKNASEIIKTMNMLVSSTDSEYLWEYMTRRFCTSLSNEDDPPMPPLQDRGHPAPSVTEMSNLIIFLLDVIPLELYADVQSQFLPEMLGNMLQTLRGHMTSVGLDEVTQGLRACFKVLSKIQMPVAYMDTEAENQMQGSQAEEENTENDEEKDVSTGQANGNHEENLLNGDGDDEGEPANGVYPPLRSEDSGLGISASPSEQHLPPGLELGVEVVAMCKESDGVWRRGGSVDTMTQCLQDILAFITTRYLLVQVEDVRGEEPQPDVTAISLEQKTLLASIGGREIKDKLTGLFTPNKLKTHPTSVNLPSATQTDKTKLRRHLGCLDWGAGYMPRGRAEISEHCRQAFAATCHLLLECSTFPVYLTEEESQALYTAIFCNPDNDEGRLPVWLRSLMTLCCLSRDYHIQHTAVASMLELINHSQSLALVIQDKYRRYQTCDANPLSGKLQMVTVPPILPALLHSIEKCTDFYQRLSQVLWSQLDTERREQHISCVELFYRLHCLAPSAFICEDIICQAMLQKDKAVRLEALHRFTVLWHLTRDIQANRTMSLNRSFDRSLCVVIDSLSCTDGSISAAAHWWLIRALSLDDVIRILEPILLLLLHPSTQRCSIQNIKHDLAAGNLKVLNTKIRSSVRTCGTSADTMATEVTTFNVKNVIDRETLWAELDQNTESAKPPDLLVSRSESEETEEENPVDVGEEEEEEVESEHTESYDTSGAQDSTENSSSGTATYQSSMEEGVVSGLHRVESEHTQASESLSSDDEDDLELENMAQSRLLKQERERREAIDSLFRHVLLYSATSGWRHLLQGLALLSSLLRSSAQSPLVDALSSTSLDTSSASHLNLVSNLLQRHQQAEDGKGFYSSLLSPSSSPSVPPSLLIELLVSLCLRFLRSHYPSYLSLGPHDLQGNREVQVKSVEVLTQLVSQLGTVAQGQESSGTSLEPIRRLLTGCNVQQYALLTLSASMYVSQKVMNKEPAKGVELLEEQGSLSEESLVNLGTGDGQEQYPLQMELLKLLQALIVLEYHVWPGGVMSTAGSGGTSGQPGEPPPSATSPLAREWQTAVLFQQSIKAVQYVPSHPITAQGMFVSSAARALQPQYGYAMHPHWVSLLCSSLSYLGRSLGIIVAPVITQICRNLDELVKLYEHDGGKAHQSLSGRKENIAPDYPLTLLEGLTTIAHYCLLENKRSLVACDPVVVRNARNAVIEALPHMLNSMALLWGVVRREESQKRGSDSGQSSRNTSTSVYFKNTKVLRQRILEFLIPLTGQYGVQFMASVGAVWSSRKSKRRHKNKVLPVASEPHLIIVNLVKSLSTMHTSTILYLIKEVVKKPHQIRGDQKSTLVDIPMLQFSYTYVQSISAQALQENVSPLLSLLRESVQLNLAPPGHFLLLGIINDFVNRLPNLDNKKDSRDLQEVTQRILEAVGGIAGSSLEQTSWLSRNLEVKVQPQVCLEAEEPDDAESDHYESVTQGTTMVSSSAPSVYSVQALVLLAEILAPLLDMVYRSDEKEKAVPLISRLMYYVFPYMRNHSAYNMPSFEAGAQLLSSLSGYAYTKRAWKKEAFDLFMDPLFFTMDVLCARSWKSIIDHLLTHEKTMFKDLMSMQSGSLKLFASVDQKPMLLKRQAFAMFSGELDQYHLYLPLIQERLTETLRMNPSTAVSAQIFLMFRVLSLRISPQHLTSLWPIMVTELIRVFTRLEKALQTEKEVSKSTKVTRGVNDRNGPVNFSQSELDMYLSACKFLDASLAFPPEKMPLFQMYRWAFVPEVDVSRFSGPENALIEGAEERSPQVVRVLEGIQQRFGALNELITESSTERLQFPLLTQHSLSSITQLVPFFYTLCCSFQGPPLHKYSLDHPSPHCPVADYPLDKAVLKRLETITEEEFLDNMEN